MNRQNPRRAGIKGSLFLMLFSLPFAAVGVFFTVFLWRDVMRSHEIKTSWRQVPATVQDVELRSHRGSKGGTSYETTGSYAYAVDGRAYRSSRLGVSGGADNIGDFQRKLYAELRLAKETGRTIECYVNPADPTQAVLRPDWRPEMCLFKAIFGLVFGGMGFGLFLGCARAVALERQAAPFKRDHPGEPWLWRADWRSTVLQARSGQNGRLAAATLVLVWLHVVTGPLWLALPGSWAAAGAFKWALSGALLLVLVVSGFCARAILHALRYRGARLELDALPLQPGMPVGARFFLPQTVPFGTDLKLTLALLHRVTTGSGKSRKVTTTRLWTHEQVEAGPLAPEQEIVFRCDRLPPDARETTTEVDASDAYLWVLETRAKMPVVNLKLDFPVPVFRAPQSS